MKGKKNKYESALRAFHFGNKIWNTDMMKK